MNTHWCFHHGTNSFGITEIGDLANVIIALFTLGLGFYVFIYQRSKDLKDELKAEEKHERALKLQWFKELIILPKINEVDNFYEGLKEIKEKIDNHDLTEEQKIDLINFIKHKQSVFRKAFLDSLQIITPELYQQALKNIDKLIDDLTISISNDELKLSNPNTYDREIHSKIQYSVNDLYSLIFNYNGV